MNGHSRCVLLREPDETFFDERQKSRFGILSGSNSVLSASGPPPRATCVSVVVRPMTGLVPAHHLRQAGKLSTREATTATPTRVPRQKRRRPTRIQSKGLKPQKEKKKNNRRDETRNRKVTPIHERAAIFYYQTPRQRIYYLNILRKKNQKKKLGLHNTVSKSITPGHCLPFSVGTVSRQKVDYRGVLCYWKR